jgi:hypothetical protein
MAENSILFHIRETNQYFKQMPNHIPSTFLITWHIIGHMDQIKVQLTKSMEKTILEKQTLPQIVKQFPAFYESTKFVEI